MQGTHLARWPHKFTILRPYCPILLPLYGSAIVAMCTRKLQVVFASPGYNQMQFCKHRKKLRKYYRQVMPAEVVRDNK